MSEQASVTGTRRIIGLLALLVCLGPAACRGVRFSVDLLPSDPPLRETTVLRDTGSDWSLRKVALIDVTGLIVDARIGGGFVGRGENPVSYLTESLRRAELDPDVRAVMLRINSPGGAVTASDIMYREVMDFRARSEKPVVVLMGEMAASGGYFLACAADEIVAHPTTVTGSIGVVMQTVSFAQGLRRIGIHPDAITSGPNKAAANPFEEMTAAQREVLAEIVQEMFEIFVDVVRTSRPALRDEDIAWVTDGRVVTGRRALEIGLVDRVGDLRDAFDSAKRRAGLEHARLVKYHRPGGYVGSAYARGDGGAGGAGDAVAPGVLRLELGLWGESDAPVFQYLWDPRAW